MDLDPESEHIKTVYAHFGLAIYLAQCLEHQIVNSMVVLHLIPNFKWSSRSKEDWYIEHDTYNEVQFRKTLGQMIQSLMAVTKVPDELEQGLNVCLARRNYLAHHYFRDHAVELMSNHGRESMVAELEREQVLFRETDRSLHNLVAPLYTKYGVTSEKIDASLQELLKGTPPAS